MRLHSPGSSPHYGTLRSGTHSKLFEFAKRKLNHEIFEPLTASLKVQIKVISETSPRGRLSQTSSKVHQQSLEKAKTENVSSQFLVVIRMQMFA